MRIILLFTGIASALFIAAYYVLVRHYYWGSKITKEMNDHEIKVRVDLSSPITEPVD